MALLQLPARVQFNATTYGTGSFVVASAVAGYLTPAQALALNGQTYPYFAQSADGSMWEKGFGVYSNGVLARTTISWTSNEDQNPVAFPAPPIVAVFPQQSSTLSTPPPYNYLTGLTFSTPAPSAAFSIAAGQAADSTNAVLMTLPSSFTKTSAAWSAGFNGGALDTGTIAPSTTYHFYLIMRLDTMTVDVAVSLSASGPTFGVNIPSAYTTFRRICSIKTDASSHWLQVVQSGDYFMYAVNPIIYDNNSNINGGVTYLMTVNTPTGISVFADVTGYVQDAETGAQGDSLFWIWPTNGIMPNFMGGALVSTNTVTGVTIGGGGTFTVQADVNAHVYVEIEAAYATRNALFRLQTRGYWDYRGK